MREVNERERTIWRFVFVKNKLISVFNASVLLLGMNFVITLSKQSADPLGYIASRIHSYSNIVMTKFMINNRTNSWKTDVNLLNRAFTRNRVSIFFFCQVRVCNTAAQIADLGMKRGKHFGSWPHIITQWVSESTSPSPGMDEKHSTLLTTFSRHVLPQKRQSQRDNVRRYFV